MIRPMLFTIFFALLAGCATIHTPDPIDRLVADYSASHELFAKGLFPDLNLPKTASPKQVIPRALEMHGFTKEQVAGAKILKIRQVHIQGIYPDCTLRRWFGRVLARKLSFSNIKSRPLDGGAEWRTQIEAWNIKSNRLHAQEIAHRFKFTVRIVNTSRGVASEFVGDEVTSRLDQHC